MRVLVLVQVQVRHACAAALQAPKTSRTHRPELLARHLREAVVASHGSTKQGGAAPVIQAASQLQCCPRVVHRTAERRASIAMKPVASQDHVLADRIIRGQRGDLQLELSHLGAQALNHMPPVQPPYARPSIR